jgi:hypothetical protein
MRSSEQDVPAEEIERGEPFAAALNPDVRRTSSDLGLQVSDKLVWLLGWIWSGPRIPMPHQQRADVQQLSEGFPVGGVSMTNR